MLSRAGLAPVAGVDEAGRGACAGPLVIGAVVLDSAKIRRMPGLADSKLPDNVIARMMGGNAAAQFGISQLEPA